MGIHVIGDRTFELEYIKERVDPSLSATTAVPRS